MERQDRANLEPARDGRRNDLLLRWHALDLQAFRCLWSRGVRFEMLGYHLVKVIFCLIGQSRCSFGSCHPRCRMRALVQRRDTCRMRPCAITIPLPSALASLAAIHEVQRGRTGSGSHARAGSHAREQDRFPEQGREATHYYAPSHAPPFPPS